MLKKVIRMLLNKTTRFSSSKYWDGWYQRGGNSGSGSYGHLAQFKAEVINKLIDDHRLDSLVEFGCGDGNQLKMFNCNKYTGLDISPTIISKCRDTFSSDKTKSFAVYTPESFSGDAYKSDAAMSLDVLYHLVEQSVYDKYLDDLFSAAKTLVIIYAADIDLPQQTAHELYRKFTGDVAQRFPAWKLLEVIKNKYPPQGYWDESGSNADFYIYQAVS
jgi:cyclopropane fatty-acyl-phospholipid synthase-like methyltransferase